MAKILSPVWAIARGSIGGTTYLSGPHNAIVARNRTAPVQPNTIYQSNARGALRLALASWLATTEQQRLDWDLYAKTVNYQGPLGPYNPSGRQIFLATFQLCHYLNRNYGSLIPVTKEPPTTSGWMLQPNLDRLALAAPGTGFGLDVFNSNPYSAIAFVRISGPHPPTRYFWKGPYNSAGNSLVTVAANDKGNHQFTGLVAGQFYFVTARLVTNTIEHRISQEVTLRCEATTVV